MHSDSDLDKAVLDQKINRKALLAEYKLILQDAIAKLNKIKDRSYAATGMKEHLKIELNKLIDKL